MELLTVEIKVSSPNIGNLIIKQEEDKKYDSLNANNGDETLGLVLSAIARHGKEYNRTWVEKHFGPLDDYSTNPGASLIQVKELMGW